MANIKKSAFIELRISLLNVSAICFNKKKPSPSRGGLPKDNPTRMKDRLSGIGHSTDCTALVC